MLTLINPVERAEPFDDPEWLFEAKFDGFRAAADTVRGRLISRNGNRMQRFEGVLDLLPKGYVFDGELCGARRG
jgi:ATP-dependent DNA ligase